MKTSKHLLMILGLMLISISLSSCAAQKASAKKNIEYLYVQTADSVTFQADKMTLNGVSPTTLFFSDRPERIVGHGTTEELLQSWNQGPDSFEQDPPNATLSILETGDGKIEDIVVVLQNPQLKGSKLTYSVKVLDGNVPSDGGACALFIDIVGRPLTPRSYAGVGRRTTCRVVRRW